MESTPKINLINKATGEITRLVEVERIEYTVLEISPSSLTGNSTVKWMIAEFSRLYRPFHQRLNLVGGKLVVTPELNVWWEVFIHKGQIKFYLVIPNKDNIKDALKRQVMKTWKRANIKEVADYMPVFKSETTDVTKLSLKYSPILSLDSANVNYSPLDSLLNAKHYLQDDDMALLQIGMNPLNNDWNKQAKETFDAIKRGSSVPRKKGKAVTKVEILQKILKGIGLVAEEVMNFVGDFLIPGWVDDRTLRDSSRFEYGELGQNNRSSREKVRSEAFKVNFRILAQSENDERRKSIIRSMSSGFDPLEGDNKLEETILEGKNKNKEIKKTMERKMTVRMNSDIFCTLELAKIIQVPDQKAQVEHYNELNLVQHRGESEVPKEIFEGDDRALPFAMYEDTDGEMKTVFFTGKNDNLLCMPRVIIGEPGTGKTTFAQNFALDAFNKGFGVFMVDAADGKMIQRVLDRVRPDQRHKVKILDFMNTAYPIGLGWNEIYRSKNMDIIEDAIVEEIITYVELVAGTELNMRAKQWVENAVKAVFVTPDATLQDVEMMLSNAEYRNKVIPTIEDPELRLDWENYHEKYKPEERKAVYDEAFRRLSPVMRKKILKNFILQKPKKDENGDYLLDIRKWMDEGYLVLAKVNESLTEPIQTALVSFLLAKFNLAMISREDIVNEDDRHPCFLILDEPDHYIKGSERWRNMLTRYRKYRCGLTFMFHGWQQLKEADKDLPKIIRKAGPHYVIFQTDEDNLLELKSVIEPEFKVSQVAKGMPQWHAIIRLKMYGKNGDVVPAFMAKSVGRTESRFGDKWIESKGEFTPFDNNDLYGLCALELGRPKKEVMEEIFARRMGAEFDAGLLTNDVSPDGDGDLMTAVDTDEIDEDNERFVRRKIEHEVNKFIENQIANGEDPDYDLILHMDELLEEGGHDE
jgi:hypothetical protein